MPSHESGTHVNIGRKRLAAAHPFSSRDTDGYCPVSRWLVKSPPPRGLAPHLTPVPTRDSAEVRASRIVLPTGQLYSVRLLPKTHYPEEQGQGSRAWGSDGNGSNIFRPPTLECRASERHNTAIHSQRVH
ncbi:hypothetical protein EYF80_025782 [Liparis tanakae]|uniref:Uncharacterized protein n=1 Tax=Liparis tanakae TaxID=230148 RepID=A0A4Z2HDY4_9TELE|nr:hypothetical protein EYF80_025782 [Liparis tanakae]